MQWKMRHTVRCGCHWRTTPGARLIFCCGVSVKRTSSDEQAGHAPAIDEGRSMLNKIQCAPRLSLETSEMVIGFGESSAFGGH